ncbi:MAG TPA: DUF2306 domain-containing protein [Pyrinomonadaceae bacterium]|nr:DUF2306 domain-containing protein [Pyrinomonadaceae bacterium]
MSNTFRVVLTIHIIFGGVALLVAPGAMITRKGGTWHRRWGKVYFWAMATVAASAVVLSLLRPGLFLLLVAVFSFYLALTGYRVLYRKTPLERANFLDWGAAMLMLAGGLALVGYGVHLLRTSSFGVVAVVFGGIGLLLAITDARAFLRPPADKRAWLFVHMGRMLGAYIATVSAFSVVNFHFLPPLVRWLWPAAVGSIGSYIWARHYRRKFSAASSARSEPSVRVSPAGHV